MTENITQDIKWIMIAGPYSSGGADDAQRQKNLDVLNQAALAVFAKGLIPVVGVNCALPLVLLEGKADSFKRIMMPLSLAMSERCDACLRIDRDDVTSHPRDLFVRVELGFNY